MNGTAALQNLIDEAQRLPSTTPRDVMRFAIAGYLIGALKYDPGQPRDDSGRWSDTGGIASGTNVDYSDIKNMPSEIDGVSIQVGKLEDSRSLAISTPYGIVVNQRCKQWKDAKAYQKMAYDAGWVSTDDPNGIIYHELGHYKHRESAGRTFENAQNTNQSSNPRFKAIAPKVSKYAATNGKEFVAEVYAARRTGKEYGNDVMNLYHELHGPEL